MLAMWHCIHCDLRNYDRNEHCQACFRKAVKRSPFQQIMHQQTILFHGYLRENILIHLHDDNPIPMDIINLCLEFFEINIKSLYTETCKGYKNPNNETDERWIELENACDLTVELGKNEEYWLSVELMSVVLIICEPMASDELMGGLHYGMAVMYRHWNLPKKALEQTIIAQNTDPCDAEYIFESAFCYEKLKDFNKAKEGYLKAIQLKPNNATFHRCYAQLLCAELNELDLAKTYFNKAIELEPKVCDHYHFYAQHLRDYFKDYKESEKQYLKCLAIDTTNFGTNSSYGYLLYLMGEYDAAKKHIEIELRLSSNRMNKWAHYYLGLTYNALGDETKANELLYEAAAISGGIDMDDLNTMKAVDPDHMEYHNKLEQLIKQSKI